MGCAPGSGGGAPTGRQAGQSKCEPPTSRSPSSVRIISLIAPVPEQTSSVARAWAIGDTTAAMIDAMKQRRTQRAIERERLAATDCERLAAPDREWLAAADRERLAAAGRELPAATERRRRLSAAGLCRDTASRNMASDIAAIITRRPAPTTKDGGPSFAYRGITGLPIFFALAGDRCRILPRSIVVHSRATKEQPARLDRQPEGESRCE